MFWKGLGIGIVISALITIIFELLGNVIGPLTFAAIAILPGFLGGMVAKYFISETKIVTLILIGLFSLIFVPVFFSYIDSLGLTDSSVSPGCLGLCDAVALVFIVLISFINIPAVFLGGWLGGKFHK